MGCEHHDQFADGSDELEVRPSKRHHVGGRLVALRRSPMPPPRRAIALPHISANDMTQDLVLAQRLAPLAQRLESVSQKVADTILQAQSECWWAATAFYAALTRLSDLDPELEDALKPVVEFFARRPRPESTAEA